MELLVLLAGQYPAPTVSITAGSPLPYPWDSVTSTWTPDLLGLLCASVSAT